MSIHPRHRVPISALVCVVSFAPAIGFLALKGQAQASRNEAWAIKSGQLTTVAQDDLSRKCYTVASVAKGIEISLPDYVPASSCVTDGNRFGLLAITNGRLRIVEAFTGKEVSARKSELLKGDPKR